MKLKKLEITGFKSFSDKARIEFPEGVSAIVGPNGCGKSNIVDALRWVMGEQSVKQLRGKSMEDVIFAGARGKPPLNMAEVSLTLSNDNGSAPEELKDFTEIMLTRRLYRSGESAYFLNKQPCRLKDIHNVFLGSGMGTKSYSIIQQGNIGAIIDAGPEERRYFIEEAAGTTRFKNRKNEALRKVHSTNQNLLRVSDIIAEIKRQMTGLKRQARKAERYKLHQQRIKELDIDLGLHHYADLTLQINTTDALLQEHKDADIGHTSQLKRLDSAVEDIKLKRWQKNQEIADQKSRKFDLVRNIDRAENDLNHLRQEIDRLKAEANELQIALQELSDKNQKIASEIDESEKENVDLNTRLQAVRTDLKQEHTAAAEIKSKLSALEEALEKSKAALMDRITEEARYKNIYQNASNNKESLKRRLKRADEEAALAKKKVNDFRISEAAAREEVAKLKQEVEDLGNRLESVHRQHDEKRQALGRQVKQVQTIELERNKTKSKFSTLKKMEENFEWYRDGVQAIMKARSLTTDTQTEDSQEPVAGPEVDGMQSGAIIGLLADILEPEPSYQTAVEAALGESLQYIIVNQPETGVQAIEFLQSKNAGRSGFIPVTAVEKISEDRRLKPDIPNSLLQHINIKPGYEKIVATFLGHVIVAEDIHEALHLFNRNGARLTIVTKEGNMISHQGIMVGGSKEKLSGILAKKQELKELEKQIKAYDRQLESDRAAQKSLELEMRTIESNLQKLIEHKKLTEGQGLEAEKELYRTSEELKHALRHLEITELEQEQLLGEESDIDDEIAKYNTVLAKLTDEIATVEKQVAVNTEQVGSVASQMDEYNQKVVDLKLNLTAFNARLENSNNTLRRLKEFQEDGELRKNQISEDIVRKKQKAFSAKGKTEEITAALSGMYAELKRLEQDLEINEADFNVIDTELKDSDEIITELQSKRGTIQERARLLELEQAQRRVQRDNITNRLEENYNSPFSEYRTQLSDILEKWQSGPEAVSTDELEDELARLRQKIATIDDVNLGAINEYEQLKSRYDFLCEQHDDLQKAIVDLHTVIKKINKITQQRFLETFNLVNEKLDEVFPRLFEGGSAKLILTEPDNPLETGVEFMIHPPGKKLTRMSLLSGGEKALSAIAFIFSLFLIKPTSFCLMDEIDAPLDEANVFRFNDLLKLIGEKSQIVMVTHNKRTMEFADTLFGITMELKGISKVVAVNFDEQPDLKSSPSARSPALSELGG